jgi:predicted permease
MAITVILLMASLSLISLAGARLLKLERNLQLAVLLAVIFMNAGNFGLSLNHFALGEEALAFSGIFFAVQVILVNSVGVLVASSGTRPLREAAVGLLKVPGLYALVLALIVRFSALEPPVAITRSVDLLAQAAIPVMILLMGVQLSQTRWGGVSPPIALVTGMRLILSPLLAFLIASLLGLQGAARQATVLEAATPTAVIAIVLGTEFDLEPGFITGAVFVTTILSPLTITPILALIGA